MKDIKFFVIVTMLASILVKLSIQMEDIVSAVLWLTCLIIFGASLIYLVFKLIKQKPPQ
jgi:prolipoprotein diacylglyceryltransferase